LRLSNSLAARWLETGQRDPARSLLSTCLEGFDGGSENRDVVIARHLLHESA
jgi:hypothetical protein